MHQGSSGDNSLQSLSDDLISNELDNIHSHQDGNQGSAQPSDAAKGSVDSAREQSASAVEYVEGQLKSKSGQVHSSCSRLCCACHELEAECCHVLQEDPEVRDFKNAAADTAHDVKESVKPDDKAAGKDASDKSVLQSVSFVR